MLDYIRIGDMLGPFSLFVMFVLLLNLVVKTWFHAFIAFNTLFPFAPTMPEIGLFDVGLIPDPLFIWHYPVPTQSPSTQSRISSPFPLPLLSRSACIAHVNPRRPGTEQSALKSMFHILLVPTLAPVQLSRLRTPRPLALTRQTRKACLARVVVCGCIVTTEVHVRNRARCRCVRGLHSFLIVFFFFFVALMVMVVGEVVWCHLICVMSAHIRYWRSEAPCLAFCAGRCVMTRAWAADQRCAW